MYYMSVIHKILVSWKTKIKQILSMKGVFHGEENGKTFGEDGNLRIDPEFCRTLKLGF